jgi:hydrogenase nickel incorporation protein HypA/HybF
MHELSVSLSILDLAAEEAKRHGDVRVRRIHVRLGPLAGVVKEALISAFDLAREASSMQDAELVVEEVPIEVACPRCQATRKVISVQQLFCAECGTAAPDLESGRELELVALEIQ